MGNKGMSPVEVVCKLSINTGDIDNTFCVTASRVDAELYISFLHTLPLLRIWLD